MSIQIGLNGKLFKLDTATSSYVLMIDEAGYPGHLYYGARLHGFEECEVLYDNYDGSSFCPQREGVPASLSRSITMQEYTTNEIGDFKLSSVSVRTPDGINCTDPRFVSAEILPGKPELPSPMPQVRIHGADNIETLAVTLADPFSKIEMVLYYTVFPDEDVIVRSVKFTNRADIAVQLERAMSLCLDFPHRDFDLIHTPGTYARERWAERVPLHSGTQGFFSTKSSTGHNHNPVFALAAHDATENAGEVFGAMLVYSGSFKVEIEVDPYRRVRAVMGINPDTFEWKLEPGESFHTPESILTFSASGIGQMSRNFHDMIRTHLIAPQWAFARRAILVNNWEATYFKFDREKLLAIARDASTLGIEMLVLDDGWFGHRDNDRSSLGDWVVYQDKIGDLRSLVEEINALGLKFGLWFEPEMISEDSDLYRAHPEWVFTVPGRDRSSARNQFVLNMADPDVVSYLFETISGVLRSANIEYIKWDMNRQPAEKYCAHLPPDRQKEAGHRFVLGVYELHRRLLEAFPNLFIEGCSGGGGRFDAGMLYYVPQIWTSDDTDAMERLRIQGGTSLFYPVSSISAHVSVCPNHGTARDTPFRTRGYVAFSGTFGYELDLNKLSAEDRVEVKRQTAEYHRLHHLVERGDLYRLINPEDDPNQTAWAFVAKDRAEAVCIYVQPQFLIGRGSRLLRMNGLSPEKRYAIRGTDQVFFGSTLMNAGIPIPPLRGDGASLLYHFVAVDSPASGRKPSKTKQTASGRKPSKTKQTASGRKPSKTKQTASGRKPSKGRSSAQ